MQDGEDGRRLKKGGKESKGRSLKVVLRRLPPALTWPELQEQLSPIPPHSFIDFCPPNHELSPYSLGRVVIAFEEEEDVIDFAAKFSGYLFVDSKGNESLGLVEFAPFPKVPIKTKEDIGNDKKIATVESDPMYLDFLARLEEGGGKVMTIEEQLAEIDRTAEVGKDNTYHETPLTQFFLDKCRTRQAETIKARRRLDRDERKKEEKKKMNQARKEKENFISAPSEYLEKDTRRKEKPPRVVKRTEEAAPITSERVKELFRSVEEAGKAAEGEGQVKQEKRRERRPREVRPKKNTGEDAKKAGVPRPERPIYQPGARKKQQDAGTAKSEPANEK